MVTCPHCGSDVVPGVNAQGKYVCPECNINMGRWAPPQPQGGDSTNGLAVASFACAVLALLIFPPAFGIAGAIFGAVAGSRGNVAGWVGMVVSLIFGTIGMIIGMIVFSEW